MESPLSKAWGGGIIRNLVVNYILKLLIFLLDIANTLKATC